MKGIAQFNLLGNLTRDPEVKTFEHNGENRLVCKFALAVNPPAPKGKDPRADFFECVLYGPRAEVIAQYVKKGDPLYCTGSIRQERWEDDAGNNRSSVKFVVRDFNLLSSNGRGNIDNGDPEEGDESPAPAPAKPTKAVASPKTKTAKK